MSNLNLCNLKDKVSGRVFTNIEDINRKFGVEIKLPEHIPDGCNLLCYKVADLYDVRFFHPYKLDDKLYHYVASSNSWDVSNESLELEIIEDNTSNIATYIYLHLTQQDSDKPKFTPERLLGVLTDLGYVEEVGETYLNTEKYLWCGFDSVKYYISDDSDETVSFDEYVEMFYNMDNTL